MTLNDSMSDVVEVLHEFTCKLLVVVVDTCVSTVTRFDGSSVRVA